MTASPLDTARRHLLAVDLRLRDRVRGVRGEKARDLVYLGSEEWQEAREAYLAAFAAVCVAERSERDE